MRHHSSRRRTSAPSSRSRNARRRLGVESLEDRRLMAAAGLLPTGFFDGGLGLSHGPTSDGIDAAMFTFDRERVDATSAANRTVTHVIDGLRHQFTWDPAPEAAAESDPIPAAATLSASLSPLDSIPVLNSNPGAAASLYLDFNGHFQSSWGAWSNITTPVYDDDGDESTFSDAELATMQAVWQRVAEDYLPFNINVTTVEPASLAAGAPESGANGAAMRIAIGGTSDWMGASWGGFAYLNSFTSSIANVAYVFAGGSNSVRWMGDTVSHEAGHAFGLLHQSKYDANGVKLQEYYSGTQTWTPLMGYQTLRDGQISTWHNGTSASGPTDYQDDVAEIARPTNGFGFRADDHGSLIANATPLTGAGTDWTGSGFVGAGGDVDWFSIDLATPENLRISVSSPEDYHNLDAALELRDAAGALIASADPGDSFDASFVRNLVGRHYIGVKSNGEYGRLGEYTVSVTESLPDVSVSYSRTTLTTSESGRSESVTLTLASKPTADVIFNVASSNTGEGVVSTSAVVFTPDNWFTPQTVTVTGVADGVVDGAAGYLVTFSSAVSSDPAYNGFDPADMNVVNLDEAPGTLYWLRWLTTTDYALLQRSSLAGDAVETLVDIQATYGELASYYTPSRLAIDIPRGKVYWTDENAKTISRANLDGSSPEIIVSALTTPSGIAIDSEAGKLYWADAGADKIQRANLDGSGIEDVLATPLVSTGELKLDTSAGKMYWTDASSFTISRANLDGSSLEIVVPSDGASRPGGLELDVAAGKMYFSLRDSALVSTMYRSDLDGANREPLLEVSAIDPGHPTAFVRSLTIDHNGRRLYWSDPNGKHLYSADLDGSHVATIADGGFELFTGVAILPALPGFTVTPTSGLATTEAGGTASFTVALSAPPTADVVIPVSSSDATEGTVSASSLTFTSANWNTPQTVTITGVDDAASDGDASYAIVLGAATSADVAYDALDPADVSVTNRDDDAPLFADSFEVGTWNGLWVEDSQNDWFRSTQRATEGSYSAEVDGYAGGATLTTSTPLDLSGYASAELTFDWLIEGGFDGGEYLALDVFNGSSWINDVRRLDGNSDAENVWHGEVVDLTPYLSDGTLIRFRASVSGSSEDANVDNVRITAGGPATPNVAPTADAGGPYLTNEGSAVTLNGAGSSDVDGTIVAYEWDFDGDGAYDDASGATPSFSSTADGTYAVGLRVTDNRGASATAAATITVANVGPVAVAGGPYAGAVGQAVALDAAGSTDPGNDIASYQWDLDNDGQYDDASGASVAFSSATSGVFPVSVRVTDDDGAASTSSTTVTITDAPTETVVFADSFEVGTWNGLWVEDSQNDWFRSTQRATEGSYSAEVDGYASGATLTTSTPLDLSGYASAELTFDWLIEGRFDGGEYLALDVFNGSSWINDVRRLNGNSDAEDVWHGEVVDLSPYLSAGTLIRFRASVSSSTEDANVDNVRITAGGAAQGALALAGQALVQPIVAPVDAAAGSPRQVLGAALHDLAMASIGRVASHTPSGTFWNHRELDRDVQRSFAEVQHSRWGSLAPLDRHIAERGTTADGARDEAFGDWTDCGITKGVRNLFSVVART